MRTRISTNLIKEIKAAGYKREYWENFDYSIFKKVIARNKTDRTKTTYADIIIMADTETSKKMRDPKEEADYHNHVCAWSCSFRILGYNIATLWGKRPSDLPKMLEKVKANLTADEFYVYFHNLPYDWIFLRKFFFQVFGYPEKQLNVKSLYPIQIKFENGLILKDSLILAQKSLDKWGKDMQVEHAKAVGKWDYELIRNFNGWDPDEDELEYMECDVLCGVECIDDTLKALKKNISSIPLTATGIPRGECRNIGRKNRAHDWCVRVSPEKYEDQLINELTFHGGYTHENRFCKDITFPGTYKTVSLFPLCEDFSSSYPGVALTEQFPSERFWKLGKDVGPEYILNNWKSYAFIIRIQGTGAELRDPRFPMPVLSFSKCLKSVNPIEDNGRLLAVDYFEMYVTEMDFLLIYEQYKFRKLKITDVRCSKKAYLPRWYTDYIYERYKLKTTLKGVDPVNYQIEKGKLNACAFGMAAQKPVKEDIIEDYEHNEFRPRDDFSFEEEYAKWLKNRNSFLPYCVGIWITSYAQYNLFQLGKCVPSNEIWLYSDTDSVYATAFDEKKLQDYNEGVKEKLRKNGYGPLNWKGKDYFLGVAEFDGQYMQFKALHSKCYVKRPLIAFGDGFVMGDSLKITVAGVPKKGAKSLNNNIENFKSGFLFDGKTSGKLQHTHYFVDEIYIDENGNETGDSIDLSPCDYIVNDPNTIDFDELAREEILVHDYEYEAEENE